MKLKNFKVTVTQVEGPCSRCRRGTEFYVRNARLEIPAGQSVEVTAQIKPPDKAVVGDYMVTINARPLDSKEQSADFRITLRTSTLWGAAGLGLIALAVGGVGIAVVRFGRR